MKAQGKFVSLLLLFLLAITATARAHAQERRVIPVTVVDKDGNTISGLTDTHFRLKGMKAKYHITPNTEPKRVVLLLDTSSSMRRGGRWVHAKTVVRQIVEELPADYQFALYTFAEKVVVEVALTSERHILFQKIDSIVPQTIPQRSSLAEALRVALRQPLRAGDAVLLVSDCLGPDQEKNSSDDSVVRLVGQGVRVFQMNVEEPILAIPPGIYSREERQSPGRIRQAWQVFCNPKGGKPLFRVLDDTGGKDLYVLEPERIRRGYTQAGAAAPYHSEFIMVHNRGRKRPHANYNEAAETLAALIKDSYFLELELKKPLRRNKKFKLEVVDERGKKMKGVTVLYPRLLVPLEEEPKQ